MPTIRFFTKTVTRQKNILVPVWIRLQAGRGIDFSCKSELYIHPDNWNNLSQLSKLRKGERVDSFSYREASREKTGRFDFNSKISALRFHIEAEFMQIHKKELSYAWLQETIDKFWYPDKYSVTLFKFISEYIDKTDTRINPKTSRPVCYKMKREYERTFELLKDYAADQKITLDFKDINLDFYEGFTDYLQKKNLAKNTIGKKIQTLKIFLNAAQVEGVNHYSAFKSRNFVSVTEEADTIYLNEAELESIYKKDFSSAPHLDRIRDLFLVGCWTGCRFSDWNQITPENISEGMISIKQTKTGDPVKIPLHPVVRSILGKYDGRLPALISNQKFNDALKKVAEAAEINDTVTKRTTKGGTIKTKTFEKWELVTSHCARRSFATNQYKSGVPSITIMAVTGHRSEKAFLKYLRVTSTEHAKKMQEHWDQRYLKVV